MHAGARRIDGGTARLVDALTASLPAGTVRLGVALQARRDQRTYIELLPTTG